MRTRLPASERTSQRIAELRERLGEGDGIGELMRLGIRELVEKALEEEVEEALGRGYYARGGERRGWRTGRLATAEGDVEFGVPQVRATEEPFESRVRAELPKRTDALEDLWSEYEAFATRDLSDHDVVYLFVDGIAERASWTRLINVRQRLRSHEQARSPLPEFPARTGLDR